MATAKTPDREEAGGREKEDARARARREGERECGGGEGEGGRERADEGDLRVGAARRGVAGEGEGVFARTRGARSSPADVGGPDDE